MRTAKVTFVLLFFVFACVGQTPNRAAVNGLVIVEYDWGKERIDWERDPLRVTNESYSEMRDRVRTERRGRSALEERSNKEAREEQKKPGKPPRYVFRYELTVQNTGPKAIKEIDWDYLFVDETTGELLGQREFTSVETVQPGKKKQLSILASSPPTHLISVHSLGSNERKGLAGKVVILRILYDDGTVWTAPS